MNAPRHPSAAAPKAATDVVGRPVRAFFASEWGLMALALVLAVLLWLTVRDTVEKTARIDYVKVRPVTSPGFWVRVDGPVTLELRGPPSEVEEAQARLDAAGKVIDLIVADLAEDETSRRISSGDHLSSDVFPERLLRSPPDIKGTVYRLVDRAVDVEEPGFKDLEKWKGVVAKVDAVEPRHLTVRAPKGALGATIRPDLIDAAAFLESNAALTLPQPYTLTFEGWRSEQAGIRSGVELPVVRATVSFQLTTSRTIENRLVKDVPAGLDYRLRSTEERIVGDRYRGELWAPEQVLNELEASRDKWCYVLTVAPPEKPPKPGETVSGQAAVEWIAYPTDLRGKWTRGLIRFDRQPLRVDLTAR